MNLFDRLTCAGSSLFLFLVSLTGLLEHIGVFPQGDRPLARAVRSWFFAEGTFGTTMISFTGYLLLFGMGLLLVGVAFRRPRQPASIRMETGEGDVEIARDVLVDLIRGLRDNIDGIVSVDPLVTDNGEDIDLVVEVEVDSSGDIPVRLQRFKKALRERLMENYRIKNLDRVTVRMKNISETDRQIQDIDLTSDDPQ